MTTTIGQTWRALRDRFSAAGIETASLDARLLVRHVLGLDDTGLIARETNPFPSGKSADLEAFAARRLSGEPVARIIGAKEFYGLAFTLNADTLVPRPETELLVDFAIAHLKGHPKPSVLDLGTGTGCIAIAILANLTGATGVGTDISSGAIEQARANAHISGVADRFTGLSGSWYEPLGPQDRFDLIASNPPYISSKAVETLDPDVREYDPRLALDGGPDGLAPYRIIVLGAALRLKLGGALAVEIGYDQGEDVISIFRDAGFDSINLVKDLSGNDRMVTAKVRESVTGL